MINDYCTYSSNSYSSNIFFIYIISYSALKWRHYVDEWISYGQHNDVKTTPPSVE